MLQLAKRKADELEDFSGETDAALTFPNEVTDEGCKLVEELLQVWSSRCVDSKLGGEDVDMESTNDVDSELVILKQCLDEYEDKIITNAWIQSIIAAL